MLSESKVLTNEAFIHDPYKEQEYARRPKCGKKESEDNDYRLKKKPTSSIITLLIKAQPGNVIPPPGEKKKITE